MQFRQEFINEKKALAYELALAWWNEVKAQGRTLANCDGCNSEIAEGQGYLWGLGITMMVGSTPLFTGPNLYCEPCFYRVAAELYRNEYGPLGS
jgi:hypothetical protein